MSDIGPIDPGPTLFLARDRLPELLSVLRDGGRQLIGPRVRNGTIELGEFEEASDLPLGAGLENEPASSRLVATGRNRYFDQPPGATSWKRWTFPPRVPQLAWPTNATAPPEVANSAQHAKPLVFLGVRACEIAALKVQDRVLKDGPVADPDYVARRADDVIVAVECAVAGSTCFCTSMGTGPEVTGGFDVALSELDDGFTVRVGSATGRSLVDPLGLPPASNEQAAEASESVARVRSAMGRPMYMDGLPARLISAAESPAWADVAERCLACTNCTLVCPTCFCTGVTQASDLDGGNAAIERRWDSCFSTDFARVAGGNFRPERKDRYRQWLTHKFGTWWEQFGTSGCVGCGRCITWCPVGIDVRDELMRIAGAGTLPVLDSPPPLPVAAGIAPARTERATPEPHGDAGEQWIATRVAAVRADTRDVVTLRLETDDKALLAGRPGQFVMAALPAQAAPPISVSRFGEGWLELTVRSAGPSTRAICELGEGDRLSVRGPLGRGWPVELVAGRDVLVVAGGIGLAPLRPLIDEIVAHRAGIGRVQLAYGARTPVDRLYVDELDEMAAADVIEVAMTVDRAGPEWLGRVGVVTQVIDRAMCSCDRTVAFVCGPERMMQATAATLLERGVPAERIFVTLERHMECGVGLCGHCQLGRFFVCRDGPVFSLAELGPAFRLEGL